MVLDAAAVSAEAHVQPWQTMGWQNFLIYEIHAQAASRISPPAMPTSFDFLVGC